MSKCFAGGYVSILAHEYHEIQKDQNVVWANPHQGKG